MYYSYVSLYDQGKSIWTVKMSSSLLISSIWKMAKQKAGKPLLNFWKNDKKVNFKLYSLHQKVEMQTNKTTPLQWKKNKHFQVHAF